MSIGRFYAMVGALLRRPSDGKYLVLRRSPDKDFASGAWECITGRVDQGEGFPEAVRREVREELGVEVQVDFIVGLAHFYRGEEKAENEIVGVQFCGTLENPEDIQRSGEHAEHRWITAQEAEALFPEPHWLGRTVRRAELIRSRLSQELADFYRQTGFAV